MRTLFSVAVAALALTVAAPATAADYVYVGSWKVSDGVQYPTFTTVYSGQEAAALLFGGSAADYAISTLGSDPTQINFMAYYDVYGTGQTLAAQNKHTDLGASGYNTPGEYSAYIHDNSVNMFNYAFRISQAGSVPEPATWAMMLLGFGGIGFTMRRQRSSLATA